MDPGNKSTSVCWDLDMTMGIGNDQRLLLDHLRTEFFQAMDPSEPHLSPQPVLAPSNLTSAVDGTHGEQRRRQGDPQEESAEVGGEERLCAMKEMMYRIAAMQPVDIDPATIRKPKRRNVRISDDPQSVAARRRRERISERIRVLQRLVPGGVKMDTASMLEEAIRYVKFLQRQVQELQQSHPRSMPPAAADWQAAAGLDAVGSTSSSSPIVAAATGTAPSPGLGFGFSGDGSCRQGQMH